MTYDVKILADSIASGVRLTTLQATYPRIIHSELMTHRVFSRNAASSRAIPVEKSIERVMRDPFVPEVFGKNQKGMQSSEFIVEHDQFLARESWTRACADAMRHAEALAALGVHKHLANRVLEPYSWITTIITGTEWSNFFALRCHPAAAPEFQKIAGMMRDEMATSAPHERYAGQWHLPMVNDTDIEVGEFDTARLVKLSVARCARVSYLTHEGKRDIEADLALYEKLAGASPPHLSPCEHAARVAQNKDWDRGTFTHNSLTPTFYGNFRAPWIQHRKDLENEQVFRG